MDELRIAEKLTREATSGSRGIKANRSNKRFTLVLRSDDFRSSGLWRSILDDMGIPAGEEADFNDPDEVELKVVGGKAY